MATSSFFRQFVVTDPDTIERVLHNLENPIVIIPKKVDYEKDQAEGLKSLDRLLEKLKAR